MSLFVFHSPPLLNLVMILLLLALVSGVLVLIVTFIVYNVNKYRSRKGITTLEIDKNNTEGVG